MEIKSSKLIRQLDEIELGRFHVKLIIALGVIWVFDGYEVCLLAVAGLEIQKELQLTS
jgi:hypothetical protein